MTSLPKKKTKIKPPKRHGLDVPLDDAWSSLCNSILEVFNHNAGSLSFEECYRHAYNLVCKKQGPMLYDGSKALISENINRLADIQVIPAFPASVKGDQTQKSQEAERFLIALRSTWDDHVDCISKLRDILRYMDRVYTPNAGLPEIYDAGMALYLQQMLRSPIREHLTDAVLNQVRVEREGYAINRSAVKSCVDILQALHYDEKPGSLSVYKHEIEPAVLRDSEAYYLKEGRTLIASCDSPNYLKRVNYGQVEERFTQEEARAVHYLSADTAAPLRKILEDQLLTAHLPAIVSMPNSGLDNMLDLDQEENLARLYRLFQLVPEGPMTLRHALKASVLRRGTELNSAMGSVDAYCKEERGVMDSVLKEKKKGKAGLATDIDAASKWVQNVLALKDKFDILWTQCFDCDLEIEATINEAFESFINRDSRSPEYVSLYIDENLKKGLKGKTDQEVEAILEKSITVFRYLTDKDVFERYYKLHLAKRLLGGRSVSDDAEHGMLAKLKLECGFHFTQKLEGMFTDMKLSADIMDAYRRFASQNVAAELEMSVIVMASNSWPSNLTQKAPPCILPECMLDSARSFEKFYLSRHNGRKMTWQLSLGNADVKVAFKARKHDVNVSTYALVILLLFENTGEGEFLTYEEIRDSTGLEETELKRQLQSLACAKFKILKKHPPSRDVNSNDSFSFNEEFSAPMYRIKIQTISNSSRVETVEEQKETLDRVEEERRHQTDACIVRIMKNRKYMSHIDLVLEVTRHLSSRFLPQPLGIKKRIENLIEREYLERCPDRKSYKYLA